jgi:hypothetical protein
MKIPNILERLKKLSVNPEIEWSALQTEPFSKKEIVKAHVLPLIILVGVCSIIGDFVFMSRFSFSYIYMVIKAIGIVSVCFLGLNISTIIINELRETFGSAKDYLDSYKLVFYTVSIGFFILAIVLLIPFFKIIWFLVLFSFYLYWNGAKVLTSISNNNRVTFVLVSLAIIAGVYWVLYKILEQILLGIFGIATLLAK